MRCSHRDNPSVTARDVCFNDGPWALYAFAAPGVKQKLFPDSERDLLVAKSSGSCRLVSIRFRQNERYAFRGFDPRTEAKERWDSSSQASDCVSRDAHDCGECEPACSPRSHVEEDGRLAVVRSL